VWKEESQNKKRCAYCGGVTSRFESCPCLKGRQDAGCGLLQDVFQAYDHRKLNKKGALSSIISGDRQRNQLIRNYKTYLYITAIVFFFSIHFSWEKEKKKIVILRGITQLVRLYVCSPKVTTSSFINLRATRGLHGR
jgi:hypothetical protein